jgi:nucleoside-diphosphate-sugar epimerase
MRVLVTGGSGRVGQFAIAELVEHGYDVVNADRMPPTNPKAPAIARQVRFVQTDLSDIGQVAGVMATCDAVIHLGAIPNPYGHADEVVFENNVMSTFAVFQAASLIGVKNVTFASSISAYGTAYAPVPFPPQWAPVTEDLPMLNHDAYGLSKEVDERTGEMFSRRDSMSVKAMRFHWVAYDDEIAASARIIAGNPYHDNLWRLLWGYVEIRDAATACRLAMEATPAFEAFNITAADTLASIPTDELLQRIVPEVERRESIPGFGTAFSIEKARQMLGYEPAWSWRS